MQTLLKEVNTKEELGEMPIYDAEDDTVSTMSAAKAPYPFSLEGIGEEYVVVNGTHKVKADLIPSGWLDDQEPIHESLI